MMPATMVPTVLMSHLEVEDVSERLPSPAPDPAQVLPDIAEGRILRDVFPDQAIVLDDGQVRGRPELVLGYLLRPVTARKPALEEVPLLFGGTEKGGTNNADALLLRCANQAGEQVEEVGPGLDVCHAPNIRATKWRVRLRRGFWTGEPGVLDGSGGGIGH